MLHYLAYGSNLHPARLQQRLGSVVRIGNAQLAGWRLCFHKRGADGSGKGNLIQAPGSVAWGVVFGIDAQQKAVLDEFEGDGYDCIEMPVTVEQQTYHAFCYMAQPDWIDNSILPHDWYRDLIYHGARHAQFETAYVQGIQTQPVQIDAQGYQRHARLLTEMRGLEPAAG